MTYEQLKVLDAIVTKGGFRAASDYLFKSQSAISHAIKKLENELSIELFDREIYRPTLTVKGRVFYQQSLAVLQQFNHLTLIAKDLNNEQELEVNLSVSATSPMKKILSIIAILKEEYPKTHIKLSSDMMGGSLEKLMNNEADIVIASQEGVNNEQVELRPYETVTMIPVAHPMYGAMKELDCSIGGHEISSADLLRLTQIVVSGTSSREYDQSRNIVFQGKHWTVSDLATKKEIILSKLGWGGLPKHMIEEELMQKKLIPLNIAEYLPVTTSLFVMRKRYNPFGIVSQKMFSLLGAAL